MTTLLIPSADLRDPVTDTSLGWRLAVGRAGIDLQTYHLPVGKCTIGSSPRCHIRLPADDARPIHCVLNLGETAIATRWSPGIRLNGRDFATVEMQLGDCLTLGPWKLKLLSRPDIPDSGIAPSPPYERIKESGDQSSPKKPIPVESAFDVAPLEHGLFAPPCEDQDSHAAGLSEDVDPIADICRSADPARVKSAIAEAPQNQAAERPGTRTELVASNCTIPVLLPASFSKSALTSHAFADRLIVEFWTANFRLRRRCRALLASLRQSREAFASYAERQNEIEASAAAHEQAWRDRVSLLEAEFAGCSSDRDRLTGELHALRQEHAELAAEAQNIQALAQSLMVAEGELSSLRALLADRDEQLQQLLGEKKAAQSACAELESRLRLLEDSNKSVTADPIDFEIPRHECGQVDLGGQESKVFSVRELEPLSAAWQVEAATEQQQPAEYPQAHGDAARYPGILAKDAPECPWDESANETTAGWHHRPSTSPCADSLSDGHDNQGWGVPADGEGRSVDDTLDVAADDFPGEAGEAVDQEDRLIEQASDEQPGLPPWEMELPASANEAASNDAPEDATDDRPFVPASFIDRYRHLLSEDDQPPTQGSAGVHQAILDEEYLSPSAPIAAEPAADDSDEALQAYMSNLLRRVRGDGERAESAPQPSPGLASWLTNSDRSDSRQQSLSPNADESLEIPPRRLAPPTDLAPLRELANASARGAIAEHRQRRHVESITQKATVVVLTIAAAVYCFVVAPGPESPWFWTGAATGVLGMILAMQLTVLVRQQSKLMRVTLQPGEVTYDEGEVSSDWRDEAVAPAAV